MGEHLNENQWLEVASGEGRGAAEEHLANCRECREELEQLRGSLEEYQRAAREMSERPESFWLRQRSRIVTRAQGKRAVPRLAWVTAAAVVLVAALALGRQTPPPAVTATQAQAQAQQAQAEADSALLVDVQRYVQRDVPEALWPAALLVEEMNQHAQESRNP
jgi:hypothetical protein